MDERQVGKCTVMAYLLVSAEWHLPGREGNEKESIGSQKTFDGDEQLFFIDYMLNDVVH